MHAQLGAKDAGLSAAAAYDRIAADYDRLVEGDAWMRLALHAHYRRVFRPGQRVLDIGCGTGLDAVALASWGLEVLAVDASPAMVEQARQTVARADLSARVRMRAFDASELARLDWLADGIDGAVSAFAALNTLPDLDGVAAALASSVRPGGHLVLHMLNRFSSWEWLGLIARRQWRAARHLGSAPTREFTIGGQRLVHVQYAPHQAARHFLGAGFRLRQVYSFGALRPPHTVRRIPPPVVASLEWLDLRLGGLPPLRDAGRFFVLDLERRATPG